MELVGGILSRKSVRRFSDREITDKDIHTILQAGMSGPTCANARQWSFLVVQNRETLIKMAEINGPFAKPLKYAKAGILACGDLERSFRPAEDYWIIDVSIAVQNMVLAAHGLGLGSVWLGTYPQMDRVKGQAELFRLPKTIIPHSILALGYPDGYGAPGHPRPDWEEDRVHFEAW